MNSEVVLSIVAILISICTLFEIIRERRMAYKPTIIPDQYDYLLQLPKNYLGAIWKTDIEDIYLKKENPNINTIEAIS